MIQPGRVRKPPHQTRSSNQANFITTLLPAYVSPVISLYFNKIIPPVLSEIKWREFIQLTMPTTKGTDVEKGQ